MLAKYYLNKEGTSQSKSNPCYRNFSSEVYWYENQLDINTETDYPKWSVQNACVTYGNTIGGKGRMLTKSEAEKLANGGTTSSGILYGQASGYQYMSFWLGSAGRLGWSKRLQRFTE